MNTIVMHFAPRHRFGRAPRLTGVLGLLFLAACGGGSDNSEAPASPAVTPLASPLLVRVAPEPEGANCQFGGTKVLIGQDSDGDGILGDGEITNTAYSCNLEAPATPLVSLVNIVAEPPGANCANGGSRISAGLDQNRNGILDDNEVTSTHFVCNGTNGGAASLIRMESLPAGDTTCANGGNVIRSGRDLDGDGVLSDNEVEHTVYACNGATGSDGVASLIEIAPEPAGQNCRYGGQKIQTGKDVDADGVLGPTEVSATRYVCSGVGEGWVNVSGSTQQAEPNTGYLVRNDHVRPVITLPPTNKLNVGDIVEVSGVGLAGWSIAQNPGQTVITRTTYDDERVAPVGVVWKDGYDTSGRPWAAIASSGDGKVLLAAAEGGSLYTSTDLGETWIELQAPQGDWTSVAVSGDGQFMVAASNDNGEGHLIWSNDAGETWTGGLEGDWSDVAISDDGQTLVAADYGHYLISTTEGPTGRWHDAGAQRQLNWNAVAMSRDGSMMVAAVYDGSLYTSDDSGTTWHDVGNPAPGQHWVALASSADGSRLVAATESENLYLSDDSGATWHPLDGAGSRHWTDVTISGDGMLIAAVADDDYVRTSWDGGLSWRGRTRSGKLDWNAIVASSDGNLLLAAATDNLHSSRDDSADQTTPGVDGYLSGGAFENVRLQYIGDGRFDVQAHNGLLVVE